MPAGAENATLDQYVCFLFSSIYHPPSTNDPFAHNSNHLLTFEPFETTLTFWKFCVLASVAQIEERTAYVCRLCS